MSFSIEECRSRYERHASGRCNRSPKDTIRPGTVMSFRRAVGVTSGRMARLALTRAARAVLFSAHYFCRIEKATLRSTAQALGRFLALRWRRGAHSSSSSPLASTSSKYQAQRQFFQSLRKLAQTVDPIRTAESLEAAAP